MSERRILDILDFSSGYQSHHCLLHFTLKGKKIKVLSVFISKGQALLIPNKMEICEKRVLREQYPHMQMLQQ